MLWSDRCICKSRYRKSGKLQTLYYFTKAYAYSSQQSEKLLMMKLFRKFVVRQKTRGHNNQNNCRIIKRLNAPITVHGDQLLSMAHRLHSEPTYMPCFTTSIFRLIDRLIAYFRWLMDSRNIWKSQPYETHANQGTNMTIATQKIWLENLKKGLKSTDVTRTSK